MLVLSWGGGVTVLVLSRGGMGWRGYFILFF